MTQQVFADTVGVSRSYLSEVEKGKSKPSIEMIVGIAIKMLEIDKNWLLTGEGNMYRQPADTSKTKTLKEIDESLKQLSDEQRQEIRDILSDSRDAHCQHDEKRDTGNERSVETIET